jgi:hypothetical protein
VELRQLCSIFRPENVFTSVAAAAELQGLTGSSLSELVAFRPDPTATDGRYSCRPVCRRALEPSVRFTYIVLGGTQIVRTHHATTRTCSQRCQPHET